MDALEIIGLMLSIFFIGIFIRLPIPFALLLASVFMSIFDDALTPFLIVDRTFKAFNSFLLLAVPFFLLASNLMNAGGMTKKLMDLSHSVVGHLSGGLAQVNVLVSMLFAGISGSSSADAAGIGKLMIPSMKKEGYDSSFSVAVTACSSVMGVILPPSIMMIVWGGVMNTSIGGMFLGGAIPGILIGSSMMVTVYLYAKKHHYYVSDSFKISRFWIALKKAGMALIMPIIVVGGIITGLFTPTESAVVATLYTVLVCGLIDRCLTFRKLCDVFYHTAYFSGMMLFNIGAAASFSWILAFYQVPQAMVDYILTFNASSLVISFIIAFIFLIVGLFMDNIPAVIILGTILKPLADSAGIHPIQFAIIGVISLAYGLVTPPYGICLLITCTIGQISIFEALKDVTIFLLPMLLVLVLVIVFPSIVLWLPSIFFSRFIE